ncbi:zinc finger protein 883-like [Cydia fagiglandana]|uniref:zinc finger protein 883-like n=1 Tax=Cydia fagiglandana TaxID=1458189 RepID=UPI002FEE1534
MVTLKDCGDIGCGCGLDGAQLVRAAPGPAGYSYKSEREIDISIGPNSRSCTSIGLKGRKRNAFATLYFNIRTLLHNSIVEPGSQAAIMEASGVSVEFVRVKEEPVWEHSPDELTGPSEHAVLLPEQIKIEIEFEEQRPLRVKEELCETKPVEAPAVKLEVTPELSGINQPVVIKREPEPPEAVGSPPTSPPDESEVASAGAAGDRQTDDIKDRQTGTYVCDTCGNTYQQIHYLIQHIQRKACSHTAEKSYSCDTCGNRFATRSSLNQHRHTHASTKPYSCETCGKQFTMLSYLKAHERRHVGEKPYSCDICQKAFAKVSDVEKHKRIHTGDKPYFCEDCNKKFSHLSDLNKHKRTHTGERPYSCDVCNKKFKISTHLNTHKRIHTGNKPYTCDSCNKQFYDEASLSMHKRVHTGEKPFSCDICEKEFTRNSSLITHRRIHTHVFFCEICKKNFKQLANLKKHSKRHSREKATKLKGSKKASPEVIEII